MSVQAEINSCLMDWDTLLRAYRDAGRQSAQAEADYRRARARFIVRAKADDPKLSQAAAETLADADDEIMAFYVRRLGKAHEMDAMAKKHHWFREQAAYLRSEKVDEREASRLYSENPGGA